MVSLRYSSWSSYVCVPVSRIRQYFICLTTHCLLAMAIPPVDLSLVSDANVYLCFVALKRFSHSWHIIKPGSGGWTGRERKDTLWLWLWSPSKPFRNKTFVCHVSRSCVRKWNFFFLLPLKSKTKHSVLRFGFWGYLICPTKHTFGIYTRIHNTSISICNLCTAVARGFE